MAKKLTRLRRVCIVFLGKLWNSFMEDLNQPRPKEPRRSDSARPGSSVSMFSRRQIKRAFDDASLPLSGGSVVERGARYISVLDYVKGK